MEPPVSKVINVEDAPVMVFRGRIVKVFSKGFTPSTRLLPQVIPNTIPCRRVIRNGQWYKFIDKLRVVSFLLPPSRLSSYCSWISFISGKAAKMGMTTYEIEEKDKQKRVVPFLSIFFF